VDIEYDLLEDNCENMRYAYRCFLDYSFYELLFTGFQARLRKSGTYALLIAQSGTHEHLI